MTRQIRQGGSLTSPVVRLSLILAGAIVLLLTCSSNPSRPPTVTDPEPPRYEARLACPPGDDPGAANWEYGAHPKGWIEDPVAGVREGLIGLSAEDEVVLGNDPEGNETVVVVVSDGAVLAWVEFGRDPRGRFFPNYLEACGSAGIRDFAFDR